MKTKLKTILMLAAVMLTASCADKGESRASSHAEENVCDISAGSSDTMEYEKAYENGYESGYEKGREQGLKDSVKTVTVSGSFTATVRGLIPDYVFDGTTPRAAVITLFQDYPAVIILNEELCAGLCVGETYTFEITPAPMDIPVFKLYEDGTLSSDMDLTKFFISGYREPREDEYGMGCWQAIYK